MAFDQAAPALGARISAADLRRLARIMAPQSTADPLQFNYQEDPELQHIFGFTPPPQTPDSVEPSDSDEPEPTATAGAPEAKWRNAASDRDAAAGRVGRDAHACAAGRDAVRRPAHPPRLSPPSCLRR